MHPKREEKPINKWRDTKIQQLHLQTMIEKQNNLEYLISNRNALMIRNEAEKGMEKLQI